FTKRFILNKGKVKDISASYIDKLKIKVMNPSLSINKLSGGNQQKAILSKWLISEADIFLLDEPTRGIDVNAKVDVYNTINELVKNDKVVIFISSYLPELLAMSNRVIVLNEGRKMAELPKEELTEENVIYYASQENFSEYS